MAQNGWYDCVCPTALAYSVMHMFLRSVRQTPNNGRSAWIIIYCTEVLCELWGKMVVCHAQILLWDEIPKNEQHLYLFPETLYFMKLLDKIKTPKTTYLYTVYSPSFKVRQAKWDK